jgi:hypothetical protein
VCRDGAGVEEVLGVGEELSDPAATRNSDHAGDVGGDVRDRDEAMATTDRKTRLTTENWEEILEPRSHKALQSKSLTFILMMGFQPSSNFLGTSRMARAFARLVF